MRLELSIRTPSGCESLRCPVPGAVALSESQRRSLKATWLFALSPGQWWLLTAERVKGPFPKERVPGSVKRVTFVGAAALDDEGGTLVDPIPAQELEDARWDLRCEGMQRLALMRPVVVGRSKSAHYRLTEPEVSQAHVLLWPQATRVQLFDLSSRNGVYDARDNRLHTSSLSSGEVFRIGKRLLRADRASNEASSQVHLAPCAAMRLVDRHITLAAPSSAPVIIHGESGVGKEHVARALHERSGRRGPFVVANSACLREHLARSELFGHVAGAFTGATETRCGLFEQAHLGTLFLDEIGDMCLAVQAELLRAIETGEISPLGSRETVAASPRLVVASHRDLAAEVRAGRFRQDLFYRLYVLSIEVPPLRERPDDLVALSSHFANHYAPRQTLCDEAQGWLMAQTWKGNIRELRNLFWRASILFPEKPFALENLQHLLEGAKPMRAPATRADVLRVFSQLGEDIQGTAQALGVHRSTVHRHIRQNREESVAA